MLQGQLDDVTCTSHVTSLIAVSVQELLSHPCDASSRSPGESEILLASISDKVIWFMPSHPVVVHLTADQQHVWDEHNLIKLLPVAFNCIMCLSEKKQHGGKAAVSETYTTGCCLHSWFIDSSVDVLSGGVYGLTHYLSSHLSQMPANSCFQILRKSLQ